MRLLLDTHAFLWWLKGSARLPAPVRSSIESAEAVFVSAASAWEITTKFRIGKLNEHAAVAVDVAAAILRTGFEPLPISVAHAQLAGSLKGAHRDPFDRMLAAQALLEALPLLTDDPAIAGLGVRTQW